ncbi:uncharacterized protein APUU_80496S [Aspergillus puulaauensis]|uniref:F-box domain-containing protein n=1 Tax=Aspergillus puulaauensis TaxID=1220207 RepID=A0A7R7Y089_9EURO|nr:uncharacterized protein APUU_80496S [Aspergillus puulaauensis]BCS30193.1 hypothetical protein APUU_80496S [Aspergillus puulaauensis]
MGFLALPTEILHEILDRFPSAWLDEPRPLHQRKTRDPDTDRLYWLLSLRLVGKRLDYIIINRFIRAIRRHDGEPPSTECNVEGPPTRSSVALGKRLLITIVQEVRLKKPFNKQCNRTSIHRFPHSTCRWWHSVTTTKGSGIANLRPHLGSYKPDR